MPVGLEDQKAKPFLCEHGNWVKRVSDTVNESIIHLFLSVGGFQSVS